MLTKRTRKGALLAAAAAMAPGTGWGLPDPADAREAEPLSNDRAAAPEDADEAQLYAQEFDVDVDDARDRLAVQGQLANALGRLRDLAGERLAAAWIEHRPDLRGVIRLTGPVADQEAFDAAVADAPAPIDVRTDAALSLTQLEAERAKVQEELLRTLPGAATGIHEQSGSVMVYADGANRGERQSADTAMPEVQAVTDAPVRVSYRRGEAGLMDTYGGDRLLKGSTPWCTSGFSARWGPSNFVGYVTAGHCEPPLDYVGYDGETVTAQFWQSEQSSVTDVGFYSTNQPVHPEFYGDSRTSRRILSSLTLWNNQFVGSWVCHQGITTGYSCGSVTDRATTECYTGPPSNVCDPNWVRVEGSDLACAGGDSGGPWFNGNSGFGILHGGLTFGTAPGQCAYVIYTPIDFKFSRIGAAAMTG